MIFLGIDPGKAGGVAFIDTDALEGQEHYNAYRMPETERDMFDLIHSFAGPDTFALLEKVHSSPQMGVRSAFTFGQNNGHLRMALVASGIPFEDVSPSKWQGALRCRTKGDKNITKAKAQELFPLLKVTHYTADALLIAEYARRTHGG